MDLVDYSEDPLDGYIIFGNPNAATPGSVSPTADEARAQDISPVVTLPDPLSSPIRLEAPPLSPGTAYLLTTLSPDSLAFNPIPPSLHETTTAQPNQRETASKPHQDTGTRPSGCFGTPVINVKPSKPSPLIGVTNPLVDHLSAPRTKKRKSKCIRVTTKDITIAFGDSTDFGETMAMARTVLFGHVRGRTFSVGRLAQWVKEIWGALLIDLPEVHVLPRGWFSLHFANEGHSDLVLAKYWHIEMAPVLLKRWSPLFDPEREQIGAGPLWVRLPGLPLQYWSEEVLTRIGNALGTSLDHDRSYVETKKRTLARVLVHLDTRDGLEEKITLQWGKYYRSQILDYEGVPFRCNRCHQVGHLFKDCPLNKSLESSPKISPIASIGTSPLISRPPQGNTASQGSPGKAQLNKTDSPSPPLTRARAAEAVAQASGTTLIPPSTSIDHSFDFVNSIAYSMAQCTIPPPPLIPSTAPPTLSLSPSPPSISSSRLTPTHPYSLRPRTTQAEAPDTQIGLGIVPPGPGSLSTRGRKSDLNKAIRRAGVEVASGRQSTIVGVLRASKPPKHGPP